MSVPTTRAELKRYCLRKLGSPVIEINVSDEQVEDCIDDALQYFQEHHYAGIMRIYLKHQITEEDKSRQYIELNDNIIGVSRVLPIDSSFYSSSSLFNARYQFRLNDVFNVTDSSIIYYDMAMTQVALLDRLLGAGEPKFEFQRYENRLYLYTNWDIINVGQYIIVECFRILDPSDAPGMYNNAFLKRYLTLLIKQQWGANLIKYENIQLPGGVTLNGESIYSDATEKLAALKEEMKSEIAEPPEFFIG